MKMALENIQAGMILARDLSQRGRVLLVEGTVISDSIIRTLTKREVISVDVVPGEGGAPEAIEETSFDSNPEYLRERQEVEELFAGTAGDSQADILKFCLVQQLVEKYRD